MTINSSATGLPGSSENSRSTSLQHLARLLICYFHYSWGLEQTSNLTVCFTVFSLFLSHKHSEKELSNLTCFRPTRETVSFMAMRKCFWISMCARSRCARLCVFPIMKSGGDKDSVLFKEPPRMLSSAHSFN